jgi:7,8-dihydroneopterin aldolase/epimerase/oxygenase
MRRRRRALPLPDLGHLDRAVLDRMFLHGVEVRGRHGVLDFERRDGQRFVIDVDWWIDTGDAVATDRLEATLCYKQLHDRVCEVVGGEPWSLIETLADRLIEALFARFPHIATLQVTVHKPEAPIGGTFADVGITRLRHRPDDP